MNNSSRTRHNSEPTFNAAFPGAVGGFATKNWFQDKESSKMSNASFSSSPMVTDSPSSVKSNSTSATESIKLSFGVGGESSAFHSFCKFRNGTSTGSTGSMVDETFSTGESGVESKPSIRSTKGIVELFRGCNPAFQYDCQQRPRRVLTKPSDAVNNNGFDNSNYEYILHVHETIGDAPGKQYVVIDMLGQGTFGQVVKCKIAPYVDAMGREYKDHRMYALKIIKNKPAYYSQSKMEVKVLNKLNALNDENDERLHSLIPELRGDKSRLVTLQDHFIYRNHLCISFELMSINLFELLKENRFHGLSFSLIRVIVRQLLDGLIVLSTNGVMHCDLKPENILLKSRDSTEVKIIDFGSACNTSQSLYSYIQSRFYRSPEVLLGLPYDCAIDMWSLGCIVAELCLGLPLFPGTSEYDQLSRILEIIPPPSLGQLSKAKTANAFFNTEYILDESGNKILKSATLKPLEQYCKEYNVKPKPSKNYFNFSSLNDITKIAFRKPKTSYEIEKELDDRNNLVQLLVGVLKIDSAERWTVDQVRMHPFILGKPFDMGWVPEPPNPIINPHLKLCYENPLLSQPYIDSSISNMNYHLTNRHSLNYHHANPYPIPTNRNLDRRNSVSYDYMSKAGVSPEVFYLSAQGFPREMSGKEFSPDNMKSMLEQEQRNVRGSSRRYHRHNSANDMHPYSEGMGPSRNSWQPNSMTEQNYANLPVPYVASGVMDCPSSNRTYNEHRYSIGGLGDDHRVAFEAGNRRSSLSMGGLLPPYGQTGSSNSNHSPDSRGFPKYPAPGTHASRPPMNRQYSHPSSSSFYYFNPMQANQISPQNSQSLISHGGGASYGQKDFPSPSAIPEWDPFYMEAYQQNRADGEGGNVNHFVPVGGYQYQKEEGEVEGDNKLRVEGGQLYGGFGARRTRHLSLAGDSGSWNPEPLRHLSNGSYGVHASPGGYSSISSVESNSVFGSGSNNKCSSIREADESSCEQGRGPVGYNNSKDNFNDASFNWEENVDCGHGDNQSGSNKSHLANFFEPDSESI